MRSSRCRRLRVAGDGRPKINTSRYSANHRPCREGEPMAGAQPLKRRSLPVRRVSWRSGPKWSLMGLSPWALAGPPRSYGISSQARQRHRNHFRRAGEGAAMRTLCVEVARCGPDLPGGCARAEHALQLRTRRFTGPGRPRTGVGGIEQGSCVVISMAFRCACSVRRQYLRQPQDEGRVALLHTRSMRGFTTELHNW